MSLSDDIHTFEYPIFIGVEPPVSYLCAHAAGVPVVVMAQTRELLIESIKKHSPPGTTSTWTLEVVDRDQFRDLLREYLSFQDPRPQHIGLKKRDGTVRICHIPTILAMLEEQDRPGPSQSLN